MTTAMQQATNVRLLRPPQMKGVSPLDSEEALAAQWAYTLRTSADGESRDPISRPELIELRSCSHEGRVKWHWKRSLLPIFEHGAPRVREERPESEEQLLYVALYRDKIVQHQAGLETARVARERREQVAEASGQKRTRRAGLLHADEEEMSAAHIASVQASSNSGGIAEEYFATQRLYKLFDSWKALEAQQVGHHFQGLPTPEYLEAKRLAKLYEDLKEAQPEEVAAQEQKGWTSAPDEALPGLGLKIAEQLSGRQGGCNESEGPTSGLRSGRVRISGNRVATEPRPAVGSRSARAASILRPQAPEAPPTGKRAPRRLTAVGGKEAQAHPQTSARASRQLAAPPPSHQRVSRQLPASVQPTTRGGRGLSVGSRAAATVDAERLSRSLQEALDLGDDEDAGSAVDDSGEDNLRERGGGHGMGSASDRLLINRIFRVATDPKASREVVLDVEEEPKSEHVEGFPTLSLMRLYRGPWRVDV